MSQSLQSTKTTNPYILRVAIPSPVRRLFDYTMSSDETQLNLAPGMRVLVPFGKQILQGIVIEIASHSTIDPKLLKNVIAVLDSEPLFDSKQLELFAWASNYYQYPIGMLFDAALPAWLRKQKKITLNNDVNHPSPIVTEGLNLNPCQQYAIEQVILHFGTFKTFLLDGVTGSGKNEVYMQLIAQMILQNKQTLILVPEINLTPQTLQRFQERFNVPIALLHSQVSEKKRAESWLKAQQGQALIIIGTRSAALTPIKNPGLFIIDEEHDLSFKQQDHFRYSARDLLLKRAQLEQCPIVLGTATPSLETWHNVQLGKFVHLTLPERAGDAKKPEIEIVDVRHKQLEDGLSNYLLAAIQEQLDQKRQVLLFINRRGYAPILLCYKCGWHQTCKRCDSNMILHAQQQILRCHHCEAQSRIPKTCPQCNSLDISGVGLGTQRLEMCLKNHFPNANIARVDKDSVRTKKQLQEVLDAINDESIDILIGTQMLAKGHHFPNLTLVAIVDIDAALFSADFRATERIGQLITQVAGRTGRGKEIGKVIMQTTYPENHLLQTLIYKGYHAFLELLIKERQETKLPPYTYQILFRAETKTPAIANNFLASIKNNVLNKQAVSCLGPIAPPMEKRQGFYRSQLLMQADSRKALQLELQRIVAKIEEDKTARSVRWSVDVDPLEMF